MMARMKLIGDGRVYSFRVRSFRQALELAYFTHSRIVGFESVGG